MTTPPCPHTERCRRDTLATYQERKAHPTVIQLISTRERCGEVDPQRSPDRRLYDQEVQP